MSVETIANTIRSRWKSQVADILTLPTVYDNAPPSSQPEDAKWARVWIVWGDSLLVEIGAQKNFRTVGQLVANLFLPVEKGDKDLLAVADTIRSAFRAVTVSGVVFRSPSITTVGRTGNWWQVDVSCPFYTDELV